MTNPTNVFKTRPGRLRVGPNGPYSILDGLQGSEHPHAATSAACAGVGSAATFPCLNTHISIEIAQSDPDGTLEIPAVQYSKGRQKTAFILSESVQKLCRLYGIDRVAFLTLTFADHLTDPREAQTRLNSLLTNVVKPRYGEYCGVLERQKSGRIHYHLLVTMPFDCRTGVNFDDFKKGDYRSASKLLRNEWRYWRATARKYRFGRTEIMPIKSTEEAIGRYVGKYISKSIAATNEAGTNSLDKGVRLVRYSTGARAGTSHFTFVSKGSERFRVALQYLVDVINKQMGFGITEINELKYFFGPRWQYAFRFAIHDMALVIASLNENLIDLSKIDFSEMFELKHAFAKYELIHK
jgi:hypothetical protein